MLGPGKSDSSAAVPIDVGQATPSSPTRSRSVRQREKESDRAELGQWTPEIDGGCAHRLAAAERLRRKTGCGHRQAFEDMRVEPPTLRAFLGWGGVNAVGAQTAVTVLRLDGLGPVVAARRSLALGTEEK